MTLNQETERSFLETLKRDRFFMSEIVWMWFFKVRKNKLFPQWSFLTYQSKGATGISAVQTLAQMPSAISLTEGSHHLSTSHHHQLITRGLLLFEAGRCTHWEESCVP